RDHARQGGLRHQERTLQVDVDLLVPFLLGTFESVVRVKDAGVVEEDVEASKGADGFMHGALALGGAADVGAKEDGAASGLENRFGHGVAAFFVASGDGDVGAFASKEESSSFSDAGGASGNEGDLVGQAHGEEQPRRTLRLHEG